MHKCDVGNLKTYTDFTAKLEIFPGEADKRFAGTHVFFYGRRWSGHYFKDPDMIIKLFAERSHHKHMIAEETVFYGWSGSYTFVRFIRHTSKTNAA